MTKRLVLDAGPAQDFIQHVSPTFERVFDFIRAGRIVGITYPTLGELRGGFEGSASRERNLRALQASFRWLKRWQYSLSAVKIYGEIYATLERIGRPIGNIDMQLAAIVLDIGSSTVITYDSDLSNVPGLKVENWRKSP